MTQCRKKYEKEEEYNEACGSIHVRMSHRQNVASLFQPDAIYSVSPADGAAVTHVM